MRLSEDYASASKAVVVVIHTKGIMRNNIDIVIGYSFLTILSVIFLIKALIFLMGRI